MLSTIFSTISDGEIVENEADAPIETDSVHCGTILNHYNEIKKLYNKGEFLC